MTLISFRKKEDIGPSVAIIGAIAILLGTLIYMIAVPAAKPMSTAARIQSRNRLEEEVEIARTRRLEVEKDVNAKVWEGTPESISPQAMQRVTALAKANGLTVNAFRPQRTVESGEIDQLPFLVSMEGRYPEVMGFLKQVQNPQNRLVVSLVQVSSSDGASDRVTANVGVVAYMKQEAQQAKVAAK